MSEADQTPVDRPIMLSDLNEIRRACHNAETHTLRMYSDFSKFRVRIGGALGVSVVCAIVCVISAIVSVASASQ